VATRKKSKSAYLAVLHVHGSKRPQKLTLPQITGACGDEKRIINYIFERVLASIHIIVPLMAFGGRARRIIM
jgi:hypothetical protein